MKGDAMSKTTFILSQFYLNEPVDKNNNYI